MPNQKITRARLLITGPGGRVGSQIVPLLREHFALRLFDLRALQGVGDDEVIVGDIRDFEALKKACVGAAAMLHLAAVPDEDDFHSKLLPMNLAGAYNAFEAARQAGVAKVLFASTGQTVLNYPKGHRVTTDMPVRPSTVYGCTKVFGEALGRCYSENHGIQVICIRICWFQPYDSAALRKGAEISREWCSPRDLTQLIVKSIQSDVKFAIFFGISNNSGRCWDISNAQRLVGYAPEDDSAKFVREEHEKGTGRESRGKN
jgi:nucleoside-diphosphate-sugar epimerase